MKCKVFRFKICLKKTYIIYYYICLIIYIMLNNVLKKRLLCDLK